MSSIRQRDPGIQVINFCMTFRFSNRCLFFLGWIFLWSLGAFAEEDANYNYKIQSGDILVISILNEPDFEKEVRVSADGKVLYPLIGEVEVKNQDIISVTQKLTTLLNDYFVEPQVSVSVKQFTQVFVYGEVIKPGAFELSEKLTLLQCISLAGGLKDRANSKKINIKRKKDGQVTSIMVDLTAITQKENSNLDVELEAGDVVIVPESFL